jgi:hypothetical protein
MAPNPKEAVIVCIARYEEPYIREWIDYHLSLGFCHIYIFDNSDEGVLMDLNDSTPLVSVLHMPGPTKQFDAYMTYFNNLKDKHEWAAVIDCDEFIVLKKHRNIVDFLEAVGLSSGALAINWVLYGSNGHVRYEDKPVMQRFTKRQIGVNPHVKCIVKCSDVIGYYHPHYPTALSNGVVRDAAGVTVTGPFHPDGTDELIQINHYFTKSREEFERKMTRGNADRGEIRHHDIDAFFSHHDCNEMDG